MATVPVSAKKLTNAQAAFLDVLTVDLSEDELNDLRRVVMGHFRSKLDEEVDKLLIQRGQTTAQKEKEMGFANRTEHLRQIRERRNERGRFGYGTTSYLSKSHSL
jgi:hypothetical protein